MGQGNPRLIAWEGEKTLTFTIEDALLSDVSLSMLSGAGLLKVGTNGDVEKTYVHSTFDAVVEEYTESGTTTGLCVKLTDEKGQSVEPYISNLMPAYGVILDEAGAVTDYIPTALKQKGATEKSTLIIPSGTAAKKGSIVRVDCYVAKTSAKIIEIEARKFAGYYYIEASTLFRDEATGQDFPAEFVIPRGKIQTNFTFTMSASGDPSTFTFTIDAFPAYTKFDRVDGGGAPKKVLAAIQIIDSVESADENVHYTPGTDDPQSDGSYKAPQNPKS